MNFKKSTLIKDLNNEPLRGEEHSYVRTIHVCGEWRTETILFSVFSRHVWRMAVHVYTDQLYFYSSVTTYRTKRTEDFFTLSASNNVYMEYI